jgi:quinol monooxygenase YgiN
MGNATLFVRHQVADYGAWRAVYDSLEGVRARHSCFAAEVALDPDNKNDVFVIHKFSSLESARQFADSPELREGMGKAGVVGTPRIEIGVEA